MPVQRKVSNETKPVIVIAIARKFIQASQMSVKIEEQEYSRARVKFRRLYDWFKKK